MKFTSANTDAEIILSWLSNKSTNTRKTYEYTVKQFLEFINKSLADVKIEDLQLWINSLKLTYKPLTVTNKILYIKSLFSFCHQVGYLSINFASLVRTPKAKNELANKILTISEVKALIEAARNNQEKAILCLMYGCGLRVSEVAYLMWTDLKEDRLTIYGKGEKTRTIIIPTSILNLLWDLKSYSNSKYIFIGLNPNAPLSRYNIFRMVKELAVSVGLPDTVSPHFLRHSHASHSLKNGASLRLVQQTLGHSNIATTEKYLHISPDECSSQFIDI